MDLSFIHVNLGHLELPILVRTLQLSAIIIKKILSVNISVSPLIQQQYNYLE